MLILALDFGGTKLAAAVVKKGDTYFQSYQRTLSPPNSNSTTDIHIMSSLANELLKGHKPAAIGVSFGGPVDFKTGTVRLSHHVDSWENTPLKQILETQFKAPAIVDNDANVAALGEHRYGAGINYESLCYITVSTGVGAGWILNNQPWRGSTGMAGEIGHTVVDPSGPLCLCGKRGCVERLASGPYMAQQARNRLQIDLNCGHILRKVSQYNLENITALLINEAAEKGDPVAIEILRKSGWALGVAIGNAANLINPQRFILGGGVTKAGLDFWETLQQFARQTALPEVEFEIVSAGLGDYAPLWGAVAMAEDLLNHPRN
ncbi:MAG TPA: ROK family protein [Halomicronema sp.]